MQLPQPEPPFLIRPFQPESDFPPLVTLLTAVEAIDQSGEDTTEAGQREQMTWPGHDVTQDRWVLASSADPDVLLGYGDSWHMPGNTYADIAVCVHPAYRRRGFGGMLLQYVLARAKQQGVATVGVYADAKHVAAQSFLKRHHFQHRSPYVELHLSGEVHQPEIQPMSEYRVLPASEHTDVQLLSEALNASYGDLFGHKVVSEDYVRSELLGVPSQHWLLLVSPAQAIVGVCRVRILTNDQGDNTGNGYLDAPGVIPEHRHPALYQLLAQAGLHVLHGKQVSEIVMESWGDEPDVIARYFALGFTLRRHFLAFEYVLS